MKTEQEIKDKLIDEQKVSDALYKRLLTFQWHREFLAQFCFQESRIVLLKWILDIKE